MTEDNRFRVPLSDLSSVHVAPAAQVEVQGEPRVAEPWAAHLTAAPDGGGPGDADGE